METPVMEIPVYERLSDVDFTLADLPHLPIPRRVVMTTPEDFQVKYVINPHMEGNIGDVDRREAFRQWEAIATAYETCGVDVITFDGREGLPDMVFCANQTLPYLRPDTGTKGVFLSRMNADQRRPEVDHYDAFFRELGYESLDDLNGGATAFEGMGDALWHADRYMLWGGFGFRTDRVAYNTISRRLDVRVILLYLDDPEFYHLDTCLSVLDRDHALIYPGAFDDKGLALIRHFFPVVLEAPEDEARSLFACNAHCPDGKNVLIQRGCTATNALLLEAGFHPMEVDTDEYLKSGGSVFCMKQMIW